jgi:hypothetical protein
LPIIMAALLSVCTKEKQHRFYKEKRGNFN